MGIIFYLVVKNHQYIREKLIQWLKLQKKTADGIKKKLKTDHLTLLEIACFFNTTLDIVSHINLGHTWIDEGEIYPLHRWSFGEIKEQDVDIIINLLKTTSLSQKQIANRFGYKRSAVTMINIGKNHYRHNESYPIRKQRVKPVSTIRLIAK